MSLSLISPPLELPISLTKIKQHLRLETNEDDAFLLDLLEAATNCLENTIGQKLVTQVWRQYTELAPPCDVVRLEVYPVQNIDQVISYDLDGSPNIVNSSDYVLLKTDDRPFVRIRSLTNIAVLELDVRCGFGDEGMATPAALRQALVMLVAHWFEFRGATAATDQPISLPSGFQALIAPFRRPKL